MFEHLEINELIRLANAGGGFTIKAGHLPVNDVIRIANAAGSSGAKVTFLNLVHLSTSDLIRIANAGKGNVAFKKEGE